MLSDHVKLLILSPYLNNAVSNTSANRTETVRALHEIWRTSIWGKIAIYSGHGRRGGHCVSVRNTAQSRPSAMHLDVRPQSHYAVGITGRLFQFRKGWEGRSRARSSSRRTRIPRGVGSVSSLASLVYHTAGKLPRRAVKYRWAHSERQRVLAWIMQFPAVVTRMSSAHVFGANSGLQLRLSTPRRKPTAVCH